MVAAVLRYRSHNILRGGISRSVIGQCCYHADSLMKDKYDAIVIGAGHNGLVAAAYLQRAGRNVCVLERRHIIGGAAVTEEIIPGFKFSRASYLLSLLRPIIIQDLQLKRHGLKTLPRPYHSYTPLLTPSGIHGNAHSLLLSSDPQHTAAQIAQFSAKDVQSYNDFNDMLLRITRALDPLFDSPPYDVLLMSKLHSLSSPSFWSLVKSGLQLKKAPNDLIHLQELLLKPCSKILERWFESEPLKASLASDALIGSWHGPHSANTGYVLLHHCMGHNDGQEQAWGLVEGGMGAVSNAIASSASELGVHIFTNKPVREILLDDAPQGAPPNAPKDTADNICHVVRGVELEDGRVIEAGLVLSNATPDVTYLKLLPKGSLPETFEKDISLITYNAAVSKINVAVNALPNFAADPNPHPMEPQPHHGATIHLNSESVEDLQLAYTQSLQGVPSANAMIEMVIPSAVDPTLSPPGCHVIQMFTQFTRPMIEMVIPSAVDPTLSPPGCHVVQMFTQFTPYTLAGDQTWDTTTKEAYADRVFDCIEKYAPGFKQSVIGRDILCPLDLEQVFGLTGGDIFHGALTLDQYYNVRPTAASADYSCPIRGLYICGSGAHPGGGVSGAPGRLSALAALKYKT